MKKLCSSTIAVGLAVSAAFHASPAHAISFAQGLYGWTHAADAAGMIDMVRISETTGQATLQFKVPIPSGFQANDLTFDPTNGRLYGNLRDNAGNVRFAEIDPVTQTMNAVSYTGESLVSPVEGIEYSRNEDLRVPGKGLVISGGDNRYRVTHAGVVSNTTFTFPPLFDQDSLGANATGGELHVFDSNNPNGSGYTINKWNDPPGPFAAGHTISNIYNGPILTGNERDLAIEPSANTFYASDLSRLVRFNLGSQQEVVVGSYNYPGEIWGIAFVSSASPPRPAPALGGRATLAAAVALSLLGVCVWRRKQAFASHVA